MSRPHEGRIIRSKAYSGDAEPRNGSYVVWQYYDDGVVGQSVSVFRRYSLAIIYEACMGRSYLNEGI